METEPSGRWVTPGVTSLSLNFLCHPKLYELYELTRKDICDVQIFNNWHSMGTDQSGGGTSLKPPSSATLTGVSWTPTQVKASIAPGTRQAFNNSGYYYNCYYYSRAQRTES